MRFFSVLRTHKSSSRHRRRGRIDSGASLGARWRRRIRLLVLDSGYDVAGHDERLLRRSEIGSLRRNIMCELPVCGSCAEVIADAERSVRVQQSTTCERRVLNHRKVISSSAENSVGGIGSRRNHAEETAVASRCHETKSKRRVHLATSEKLRSGTLQGRFEDATMTVAKLCGGKQNNLSAQSLAKKFCQSALVFGIRRTHSSIR